ncbi:MAG: hypothetical protein MRY64_00670 [Hyphomonadaceae bacterium]|nr:hypothetical protein [Hyphomonadaceae bacterium]
MTTGFDVNAIARLRDLLTEERALIVTGRASEAAALIGDKAGALDQVEALINGGQADALPSAHRRELQAIVRMAQENAVYFTAIRNGLRSAINRLETMHDNAYVGSYTRYGQQVAFPQATGSYQKKA